VQSRNNTWPRSSEPCPLACLVRVRPMGVDKKGADASACNAVPSKVGRWRNGWRLSVGVEERSSRRRIPSGGRHPGFRESVALRGAMSERGPWSNHEDGGNIQLAVRRSDDGTGCSSQLTRGGEPSPLAVCGSRRHTGRSFARGCSARAIQRCHPTAIAANGGRIEALPASGVTIGWWHSESRLTACLQRRGVGFEGVVTARSVREPSSTGEGRQAVKKRGESESTFGVTATAGASNRRESGARECVRASEVQLQKSLGVCLTQRSACWSFA